MGFLTDYSDFSMESISKSMKQIIEDVKKETGATDEEIALALPLVAERFMNTNCLALPGGPTPEEEELERLWNLEASL